MLFFDRANEIFRYIKGASKSKDGKVIVKNFGYLSLFQKKKSTSIG